MVGYLAYAALLFSSSVQCLALRDEASAEVSHNTALAPDVARWPDGIHLSVDYYPSQWPEWTWEPDIARMRDSNISFVRVNEFDWSILEPEEGQYNFTVLDKTLDLFQKYGLRAIVGTPTAAPPDWLTQKYDVSFVDRTNTTLVFGSRRHYSMSSFAYREQSRKITTKLAQRYGNHSAVVGWQLDNEFGRHDTVRSYDKDAKTRFRSWLQSKYGTIGNMNEAQGRVFWSSQYASFDAVEPPFLEVYTDNEAHTLDWYTFSSDMVIDFAREQTDIIRVYAPDKFITTNFMVLFMDFDHHKFARDVGIDIATFDQYALAGTDAVPLSDNELANYLRTGVPDLQALNHAMYRGISGAAYNQNHGPFGVMEMQPGVLNWNQYRVSPLEGMVRLWTHETFAASGDMVGYFRWRQVPYAQEQTLSGLFLSDDTEDEGYTESQVFAQEDLPKLREQNLDAGGQADVALVFDYTSQWVWAIEPYSGTWSVKDAGYTDAVLAYTDLVYTFYSALRRLGLNIDIISPKQDISAYKMLVVPSLPIIPDTFDQALRDFSGTAIFGPSTASRTPNFAYPPGLAPAAGALRDRLPARVTRVETPPTYANSGSIYAGNTYNISAREEWIKCKRDNATSNVTVAYTSRHRPAKPAACAKDGMHYIAFNPTVEFLVAYFGDLAAEAGIVDLVGRKVGKENDLGDTLRLVRRGELLWAINYGWEAQAVPDIEGEVIIGEEGDIPGAGVKVWKLDG